jgi:hypothetical protein
MTQEEFNNLQVGDVIRYPGREPFTIKTIERVSAWNEDVNPPQYCSRTYMIEVWNGSNIKEFDATVSKLTKVK